MNFNPRGENLRALEQNILKFRAFEMVMILFYVEEIKSIALRTIRVTDKRNSLSQNEDERLPDGTKKLYKKLWALLVRENILSIEEKEDIERIIEYRNDIAHSIAELVFDLNVDSYSKSFVKFSSKKYEYGVLERLKKYKEILYERFAGKYVFEINMNSMLFFQAERTYLLELKKLDKKIHRLLAIRKSENKEIESEIKAIGKSTINNLQPYHNNNSKPNGQLTAQGIKCLHKLFSLGVSNIAASYLMRISLNSINKRKKAWAIQNA